MICYPCMSRVIERRFALGDMERERFRKLMRACEAFCGVRVLAYALMSNHFHLLVEVPERGEPADGELSAGQALRCRVRYFSEGGEQGVRVATARAPPELADRVIEPWLDDPLPDCDTEPVCLSSEALA